MTGPIIPADQWPEGAHLHTWDSNGLGNWLRPSYGAWHLWAYDIPLPPGHDWRVPVMRNQPAPAIDLEQFRSLARWVASSEGHRIPSWMSSHADRLLALIDASKNNNLPHVGDTNVVVSQPSKGEVGVMSYLESCSLCGLYFTPERELAEHRHQVDDDSDDDEQPNKGEG